MSCENNVFFKSLLAEIYAVNIGSLSSPFWMGYQVAKKESKFLTLGTILPDHYLQENIGEFRPLKIGEVPTEVKNHLSAFPKLGKEEGIIYFQFYSDMVFLLYSDLVVEINFMQLEGNVFCAALDSDSGDLRYINHCLNSPVEETFTNHITLCDTLEYIKSKEDFVKKCSQLGLPEIPKNLEILIKNKTKKK